MKPKIGNIIYKANMGKWTKIQKIKEFNSIHYYHVSSPDFDDSEFYFTVNTKLKTLKAYINKDSRETILTYDFMTDQKTYFNNEYKNIKRIFPYVLLQVSKALEKNNFPQDISYIA